MTENEAFYIIGNIPIPLDDENYDICQYQEAKAIALEALEKIQQYKALGIVEELRIAKEKQIPKKPIIKLINFCHAYHCPVCNGYICSTAIRKEVILEENIFCGVCGQKFDWSDEE